MSEERTKRLIKEYYQKAVIKYGQNKPPQWFYTGPIKENEPPPIITEDADFEIIEPLQLPESKK